MHNNDNLKSIFLLVLIFICILAIIYIPQILKRNDEGISNVKSIIKDKYSVNEYVPVYIDDEHMAKKYLQDYINNLVYDMDDSYNLLDRDYRDGRFGNIIYYKNFIDSLNISVTAHVSKYAVYNQGDYKIYDVYDSGGNRFIFKTNGVMQYKVYFEDEVEKE